MFLNDDRIAGNIDISTAWFWFIISLKYNIPLPFPLERVLFQLSFENVKFQHEDKNSKLEKLLTRYFQKYYPNGHDQFEKAVIDTKKGTGPINAMV